MPELYIEDAISILYSDMNGLNDRLYLIQIENEYNKGKSLEDSVKAFDTLNEFIQELSVEEKIRSQKI